MDTQNFQDLGDCPNPSNDLHAGEFAEPSLVSPVSPLGAVPFGSLVRIVDDYHPEVFGEIAIITDDVSPDTFQVSFSAGSEYYNSTGFELVFSSSNHSKDLQPHLVGHLNALLAVPNVDAANIPLLLFVAAKLNNLILLDADGVKRSDVDFKLVQACDFLRFGYEDLENGARFGRRVAAVFMDRAFEHLKNALAILSAHQKVDLPIHSSCSVIESDCDFVACAYHPDAMASVVSQHDVCDFKTCRLDGGL